MPDQPRTTAASHGRGGRRFRRLVFGALAAALSLLLLAQLADWALRRSRSLIASQTEAVLLGLLGEDSGSRPRRSFCVVDASGEPSEESLGEFAAAFAARYGHLQRVSLTSLSPSLDELEIVASATLHGRDADALATLRLMLVPGSMHEVAMIGVEVLDRRRGDLAIGNLGGYARSGTASEVP